MNNLRDEDLLKEFGDNFRKVRKSKKMTQKSLAFEADVEISQIYRLENGINNPTVTTLVKLAESLQVSPAEFFSFFKTKGKK